MVFYVNLEQNMSVFRQILWLGPLSIDISLFLFRVLFHVLIGFELADREIIEKLLGGEKVAGVEIGFKIERKRWNRTLGWRQPEYTTKIKTRLP